MQPILATSVVFALPLGNRLTGQHIGRREVIAALAVAAGLAVFLVVADPSGGRDDATATAWIVSFAVIGVVCSALVAAGLRAGPGPKATLLGIATGILFGLSAALTKTCVERLDEGVLGLLGDWELYALIVVGWVGMTLCQASLQTGRLASAMATQMVLDPVTSVLLGTLAFDETIHTSAVGLGGSLVALVVMLSGLVGSRRRRAATQALVVAGRQRGEPGRRVTAGVAEVDRQPEQQPDHQADPGADRQQDHQPEGAGDREARDEFRRAAPGTAARCPGACGAGRARPRRRSRRPSACRSRRARPARRSAAARRRRRPRSRTRRW